MPPSGKFTTWISTAVILAVAVVVPAHAQTDPTPTNSAQTGPAKSATKTTTIETTMARPLAPPNRPAPPQNHDELLARLNAIQAMVDDPTARFSATATLADLETLLTFARTEAATTSSNALIKKALVLVGRIEEKRNNPEGAARALQEALTLSTTTPSGNGDLREHYRLAENAAAAGKFDIAVEHYRAAITAAAVATTLSPDQKLGMRQDLGYALHEAGRYAEALDNNTALLKEGEKLHGANSDKLRGLITNIAQNLHSLNRLPEAEAMLARAAKIANTSGNKDKEQDLLFQLGVIAFEQHKIKEARLHMQHRIEVVKTMGDAALLKRAQDDFKALDEKATKTPAKK